MYQLHSKDSSSIAAPVLQGLHLLVRTLPTRDLTHQGPYPLLPSAGAAPVLQGARRAARAQCAGLGSLPPAGPRRRHEAGLPSKTARRHPRRPAGRGRAVPGDPRGAVRRMHRGQRGRRGRRGCRGMGCARARPAAPREGGGRLEGTLDCYHLDDIKAVIVGRVATCLVEISKTIEQRLSLHGQLQPLLCAVGLSSAAPSSASIIGDETTHPPHFSALKRGEMCPYIDLNLLEP